MSSTPPFDIVVIGAGPAGMMAAAQAALRGQKVILLEKMDRPGRKLRITGKGRCNLTNAASINAFIRHFGKNGRFLKPAFHHFFVEELRTLLKDIGINTIIERGNRVFPECQSAPMVTDALIRWLKGTGADVQTQQTVSKLIVHKNQISGILLDNGQSIATQKVILCTGGKSYPRTGSTGDGFQLAKELGHMLISPLPALVPLTAAGDICQHLAGLNLRNISASLWFDGKKQTAEFGEMLFEEYGLTGPIMLTLSGQAVRGLKQHSSVQIRLDLKPALDHQKLDARLIREFEQHPKRPLGQILTSLLPAQLIPVCMDLTGLPETKPGSSITARERQLLRNWLKDFRFDVSGSRPIEEAIITAGGVSTREIHPQTMASRLIKGLYFAGEVIDIDADTGGYNLQAAFSTGYLAGISCADSISA